MTESERLENEIRQTWPAGWSCNEKSIECPRSRSRARSTWTAWRRSIDGRFLGGPPSRARRGPEIEMSEAGRTPWNARRPRWSPTAQASGDQDPMGSVRETAAELSQPGLKCRRTQHATSSAWASRGPSRGPPRRPPRLEPSAGPWTSAARLRDVGHRGQRDHAVRS